jgi:hypothetical protein
MIPDPKTKDNDGLKKFSVGKSKSNLKHVLRVRYHTGNWIIICFPGGLGDVQTNFLVNQFHRLRAKKMITFGIRMGKRAEYNEMKHHLIESYEKMRCTYSKPRVFGLSDLPYKKYYAWVKFEKPGKKKKLKKKVVVQRRRSADYFKDETKFEGYLVDLGYDPAANLTVVSQSHNLHGGSMNPSNIGSRGPHFPGNIGRERGSDMPGIQESTETYDIYQGVTPSDRSLKSKQKISNQRISNPFVGEHSPDIGSKRKSKEINSKIVS